MLFAVGCSKEKDDDESAINSIRDAINEVYENEETLTTSNVQKYMEGNWVIVEAPTNKLRESIPVEVDPTTVDVEWTTMYITVCNTKNATCKDLKIFRNEEGKLYVGSEENTYEQE